MRKLLTPILILTAVLLVATVPFVLIGGPLERRVDAWLDAATGRGTKAALVVGLLAGDVLLPVPSSVVNTFAGKALGFLPGAAAAWLGMTAGAVIGFALARLFGRPLAVRLCAEEDLQRTDALSARYGSGLLLLARAVPVLAEASVLFFGTTDLSWRRFVVPVALGNLVIALGYAALGHWVALPIAIPLALAIPAVIFLVAGGPARRGSSP